MDYFKGGGMAGNGERTLFTPVQIGEISLKHRVVMAPLTRSRAVQPGDVPGALMKEYYGQRASDGGLIISEATTIALNAKGWYGAPGMYTDEQVEGWRSVVDVVHAKGGKMFSQLWHTGRASHVETTGGLTPVSASAGTFEGGIVSTPTGWKPPSPARALEISEIPQIVEDYRRAAERAKAAGFDGVELHGANGYLIDQFLQDGSNHRTDAYGGSIPNRARLLLEVMEALVSVWGKGRVAVRIAPGGTYNGMSDSNVDGLFDYVAIELKRFELAYLHVVEPRVRGNTVIKEGQGAIASERLKKVYGGKIIAAGGFDPQTAEETVEAGIADLVAFGRHFVANPDLVRRIHERLPLNAYDRDTFYTFEAEGYIDYPFYDTAAKAKSEDKQSGASAG
jgi:N-ethylmaleimide reductase